MQRPRIGQCKVLPGGENPSGTSTYMLLTTGPLGGETYAAVQVRMQDWYDQLKEDTVAVAHGGTCRALMVVLSFFIASHTAWVTLLSKSITR